MQYVPGLAPAGLETDGVRKFTEEELRNIARTLAEGNTALTASAAAITALTTRVAALEAWTSVGTQPVFSVSQSTSFGLASVTDTKIIWDTVDFDTNGYWDATNKRYKPLKAGYYHFNWIAYAGSSTTLQRLITTLYKNGTAHIRGSDVAGVHNGGGGSGVVALNGTTDYVEIFVFIQAATAVCGVPGGAFATRFSGAFVRPL